MMVLFTLDGEETIDGSHVKVQEPPEVGDLIGILGADEYRILKRKWMVSRHSDAYMVLTVEKI